MTTQRETAEYIAPLLAQLVGIAERERFMVLAYILAMAHQEAASLVEQLSGAGRDDGEGA